MGISFGGYEHAFVPGVIFHHPRQLIADFGIVVHDEKLHQGLAVLGDG